MKKNIKNKIGVPTRLWDTEVGGILATTGLSIVWTGAIFIAGMKGYGLGSASALFWAVFLFGLFLLIASEAIVVLPEGKYKNRRGKVVEKLTLSPFKNEYTLVSSVDLSIPMFWGRIEINMDCSNAKKTPSVDELQLALLFSGSAETPDANAEAETALFLAKRGVLLKSFKAIRAQDYDPNNYYADAFRVYERTCA